MIIDSHVHVWEMPPKAPIGPTAASWSSYPDEAGPVEMLLEEMDANGVDGAVLVQSSFSTWDNGYVADAAAASPDRFVSMGLVDPLDPENAKTAAYWMDERGMAGFRFHPLYYGVDDPAEGEILKLPSNDAIFREIESRRGIVQIHCRPEYAGQLDYAAGRYPGITWLIDHMMYPLVEWAPEWTPYRPVLDLARHGNVWIKISDVHRRSEQPFPHQDMHPVVRMAIGKFGIDRCMWGTGYPGHHRERHGWPTLAGELRLVREGYSWLSEGDRAKLLGDNARRLFFERD